MLQKQWSCKTGIKAETAMESTCSKLGNTASYAASADTATTASFIAPTAHSTQNRHLNAASEKPTTNPPTTTTSMQQFAPENQHEPHPPPPGVKISRISPACTSTVFLPPR